MKIWVLLSIANDYDQPDNNLEAWWKNKPSFDDLSEVIGITVEKSEGHAGIGKLLNGDESRIDGADYRLEEITEGQL